MTFYLATKTEEYPYQNQDIAKNNVQMNSEINVN